MKIRNGRFINKNSCARLMAIVLMAALFVCAAMPLEANAGLAKGKKAKYSVKVYNINSETVIAKGQKLKISYKATRTKGKKTKSTAVRFKSSNKKIATVSKKGVIKAKKKGSVKITVYCKRNPKKRKTIKIRVGTPVSAISLGDTRYLTRGRNLKISAKVNSSATNKKLKWTSSNTAVAKVDSKGNVTTFALGEATITAKAKDGSNIRGTVKIQVVQFSQGDARWIAHRGLHIKELENTAAAFREAGKNGAFWGCECDIWETAHVIDEENGTDTFDIVINHDKSFARTLKHNGVTREMTAEEIKEQLPKACFFDEYLDICKYYGMVPVVEYKDPDMSDDAIKRTIDMLSEKGLLSEALLISFHEDVLDTAKRFAEEELENTPANVAYLSKAGDIDKDIETASVMGFDTLSLSIGGMSREDYDKCKENGLKVGTWTYGNSASGDEKLYRHILSGGYALEFATVDYIPWDR